MLISKEGEGDSLDGQTESELADLADLSVHGPGSLDVKKEIGKGKNTSKTFAH